MKINKLLKRLCAGAVFAALSASVCASAAAVKVGDYIQMGTYFDAPILWRCVSSDENGPLILSDRIICLKSFDAAGAHENDFNSFRKRFGCNLWETSTLRCWLNSDAEAGDVKWACGNAPCKKNVWNGHNAYDGEAGFLTNFTKTQLSTIKETEQKNLLNARDKSKATDGTEPQISYATKIYSILQNYGDAYSYKLKDKIFLMDLKQVNDVYNNREVLGEKYFIGVPSEQCLENADYTMGAKSTEPWHCWLRSPYANPNAETTRHIWRDGGADREYPYASYLGVRPAFYLNESGGTFSGGNGSADKPYIIK